jgi:hypothetical protein
MPGWQTGCERSVNGTSLSNSFTLVEGFPETTELDVFKANELIPSLEKLINFRIPDLVKYKY